MEKYLILFFLASFFQECVGSFVYQARQHNTSCVVGMGGLMNIVSMIALPIILVVNIVVVKVVWWMPAVAISVGWLSAKIIGMIPIVGSIVWMIAYAGLPISLTWLIIELIHMV